MDELRPAGIERPAALRAYLDAAGLGCGELRIAALGDGHSNLTYRLDRDDVSLVLRRPPLPPYPASAHDVVREARIQARLADTAVAVPAILAICEDEAVLGAPFFVAGYLEGTVIDDVTPAHLEAERAAVAARLVDSLIALHSLDLAAAGLAGFGRGAGYLGRQVSRFGRLRQQYASRGVPELDRLGDLVAAALPAAEPPAFVHGDFRLGNVMLAPRAPAAVRAVLDWEMATVGEPLADLGWLAALWAGPGDPAGLRKLSGATAEPGYPGRAELIEAYFAAARRPPVDLSWHMGFAVWKLCVIMEGNYLRARNGLSEDAFALEYGADIAELAAYGERLARGGAG